MTRQAQRLPALSRKQRDAIREVLDAIVPPRPGDEQYPEPWETYRPDVETLDQLRQLLRGRS